ncbi:uncharacterized protein V6R79_016547 [Siganus canaliculatus]
MGDVEYGGHMEDTVELHYTDVSVLGVNSPPRKPDHCDLLLDAIDAQLGQLQTPAQNAEGVSREPGCSEAVPLRWSQSVSKDTGLGSLSQTNDTPMSCLDLLHTPTTELSSERSAGCCHDPAPHEESSQTSDRWTTDREDSEREQIMWRLERLLGDTCGEGRLAAEAHPPSDSICTEDFVRRFRDEMVELVFPESNKEEEAGRVDISDCDTLHSEEQEQNSLKVDGRGGDKPGAGGKYMLQRLGGDGSMSHRTDDETVQHIGRCCAPKPRRLAGVPVWSFDTVSIDSDLDLVCTEQVRKHIHRRPGWRSLIQTVTDPDDCCTSHSDCDTPTHEEIQPLSASVCKKETYRLLCSADGHNTDRESSRQSRRCKPERTSEKLQPGCAEMKERLFTLRQECEREEESLRLKKSQLKDVQFSLTGLKQRREHALQELEQLGVETAKLEKEKRSLAFVLRDSRIRKDFTSCQKTQLKTQRDSAVPEPSVVVMTALEREEMDRQLSGAKIELFAEQRRSREKLDSMQEKFEETRDELQRVTEAESVLRTRCSHLEQEQRQKNEQLKAVEFRAGELQAELGESKVRVRTLEKMLDQKELRLQDLQKNREALQVERDGLKRELHHLQTQHCSALKQTQDQAHKAMEAALKQQVEDMTRHHEQQIQKTEEEKRKALEEQQSLTQNIESLKKSVQLKDEEAEKLRDSLQQQKLDTKQREEVLRAAASEQVQRAIEEERRKWKAEKEEAVLLHCGKLEEQNRERLENVNSEMQQEKNKTLALQQKVMALRAKIQELESESCAQQKERESLLAAMCKSLKEEQRAELQKLQRQMSQENHRAALQLQQAAQRSQSEADRLRALLEEKDSTSNWITAEVDQQLRHWVQELAAECHKLHRLVEQHGAKQSCVQLPLSPTAAEALTDLRRTGEQLEHVMSHLLQELESQRQTTEDLRKDKERELSIQRQQLRIERDLALHSLQQRLIQEHIEELSSLNWAHVCDGTAEGGGAAASLRRQLKAKDLELEQVQRNLGQWKEQTAARLACKFEEELTAELERCKTKLLRGRKTLNGQEEQHRESARPREMTTREAQSPVRSPSLRVAASHTPSDVASLKLLCYLQSRLRQLRVENQAQPCPL